jgi:hypothetical protein
LLDEFFSAACSAKKFRFFRLERETPQILGVSPGPGDTPKIWNIFPFVTGEPKFNLFILKNKPALDRAGLFTH